jgi:glycosyltransferase involved in cell wall biosynthesis
VLAYATGGIPYANQNGRENVALVETGKMEVMADKALSILGNEAYQKTLSRNLQQLAADEYSLDRNVSRMLEAYDVIMTESKKGTVDDIQDPPI